MANDGAIKILTKIDSKGFNAGVKAMMGSFGQIATAFGVAFSVVGLVQFGKQSVETATQMEAGWQGLVRILQAHNRDVNQAKQFLQEYTQDGLVPMLNAQAAYRNMVARGYETSQLEKMLEVMKDSAVYLRKGRLDIGEAIENTTMGLRTERSILSDSSGIEQNMYKMWQAYAKEQGTTIANLTLEQKRLAEYQGFLEEGLIYAGSAAAYTETYAGKVAKLTAAMVGLKVAVGNAFIPILNALLPSVIKLVNWFTRLFNIIGRVINLLLGTNVGAKDAADSTGNLADEQRRLADETERAGKAAKGALAPFDKLNVLAQNTGSGGGVGDTEVPGIEIPAPETSPFEKAIDGLEEKIQWLKEKILQFLEPFKPIWENLKNGFENLKTAFAGLIESFGDENSAIYILGRFLGSVFILALEGVTAAFEWFTGILARDQGFFQALLILIGLIAAAIFLATHHVALIVVGVVALIAAITWLAKHWEEIWAKIKETALVVWERIKTEMIEPIKKTFSELWENIKNWAIDAWKKIKTFWNNIPVWFDTKIIQPVVNFFKGLWQSVSGFFANLWSDIVGIWTSVSNWFNTNVVEPVVGWFRGAWEDISGFFSNLWADIKGIWETVSTWFAEHVTEPVKELFDNLSKKLKEFMEHPFESLGEFVRGIFNGIIGFLNGLLNGLVNGINNIIGMLNSLSFELPNWKIFGENAGRRFGVNIPYVSGLQIPYLATGAVIPPNAPFAAILGDQSSGRNLEAPEGLIRQIIREELGAMRGFNTEDRMIHNQITIDGQVIYDAVKKVERRVGASMLTRSAA